MKRLHLAMSSTLFFLITLSLPAMAVRMTPEEIKQYKEQKAAVYERMKRYGINREDMAEFQRLSEMASGHPDPQPNVLIEDLFKPGEHYRMEMDEFVLTMKVPEAPFRGGRIWPYTTTHPLHPDLARDMARQRDSSLKVIDFSWYVCPSSFAKLVQRENCPTAGGSIYYDIPKPAKLADYSTPEALQKTYAALQQTLVITEAQREDLKRSGMIDNRASTRIVLTPEPVVINGRIWIRDAIDEVQSRIYHYSTFLSPDRTLMVSLSTSYHNKAYADPNAPKYPPPSTQGVALIEELIASVRIAKVNDDGTPDPFVIQRVAPAALPVREKRPASE